LEAFIHTLETLSPTLIYCSLFAIAYIENVFPPSPSDVIVVFGGYLVGLGTIDFTLALVLTTIGSITGFMTMYKVGDWFGEAIIEKRGSPFFRWKAFTKWKNGSANMGIGSSSQTGSCREHGLSSHSSPDYQNCVWCEQPYYAASAHLCGIG
jgi:membrane protein DedA with SNARE-associated domain